MSEVPTGVGVVTCMSGNDIIGCTVSSLISISVEPGDEKVLFALKRESYVGKIISQKSNFFLSILSEYQTEVASAAGGRLKHLELTTFLEERIDSIAQGNLFIKDSKIAFSLIVEQVIDVKSSNIFICKVRSAILNKEVLGDSLIYFRRTFRKIKEF